MKLSPWQTTLACLAVAVGFALSAQDGTRLKKLRWKKSYSLYPNGEEEEGSHWDYSGKNGPDQWQDHFPKCGGKAQSPVDFSEYEQDSSLGDLAFENIDTTDGIEWVLQNNGHTALVTFTTGNVRFRGGGLDGDYRVQQFHFHWGSTSSRGSEHTNSGFQWPLEMHIVTFKVEYGDLTEALKHSDGLAVFAVLFAVFDKDNDKIDGLLSEFEHIKTAGTTRTIQAVPLSYLLPETSQFYRYQGSLTTPPCNEAVVWTIFKRTSSISDRQLALFRALQTSDGTPMVDNFRPVQELNDRKITVNF